MAKLKPHVSADLLDNVAIDLRSELQVLAHLLFCAKHGDAFVQRRLPVILHEARKIWATRPRTGGVFGVPPRER